MIINQDQFQSPEVVGRKLRSTTCIGRVSRSIYCIPSTSSESERHFSKHKSVLTARRVTLAASAIESLVVVSSNMASGIV